MRKIYKIIISIIVVIVCMLGKVPPVMRAFANSSQVLDFDSTYVIDDLEGINVRGERFNANDYPKVAGADAELLVLSEYCYSYYVSSNDNYSVYVYVYNPSQENLVENSVLNKVQIGTSYDSAGNVTRYTKFGLKCVSVSTGSLSKIFYKFRVIDSERQIFNAVRSYAQSSGDIRPYSVGEIELISSGKTNATAYRVGKTYSYSGYAEGFGKSDGTSLDLDISVFETLTLDVRHTFYRPPGTHSEGTNVQDQLSSVYFAVPNAILEAYGEMYSAHVEWYEYLTKEILVTGNEFVYNKLSSYIGQEVHGYNSDIYYGFATHFGELPLGYSGYYRYNTDVEFNNIVQRELERLYYIFSTGGEEAKDYTLSSEKLLDYIVNYSEMNGSKEIQDKYSSDLFYEELAAGRTRYNNIDITADDEYKLESYELSESWWGQFFGNYTSTTFDGIKAIRRISESDLEGTAKAVSERLFISENDVVDLSLYHLNAKLEGKTVFLLRFAVTNYVSMPVMQFRDSRSGVGGSTLTLVNRDDNAYLAQQTAFLDLDVIDVRFHKEGHYTVFSVVSNPIDIVPDITPPVNVVDGAGCLDLGTGCGDIKSIFSLLLLVLLVIFVVPFVGHILNFLLWFFKSVFSLVIMVLSVPFKIAGLIIDRRY